jgi:hypothetical protein
LVKVYKMCVLSRIGGSLSNGKLKVWDRRIELTSWLVFAKGWALYRKSRQSLQLWWISLKERYGFSAWIQERLNPFASLLYNFKWSLCTCGLCNLHTKLLKRGIIKQKSKNFFIFRKPLKLLNLDTSWILL